MVGIHESPRESSARELRYSQKSTQCGKHGLQVGGVQLVGICRAFAKRPTLKLRVNSTLISWSVMPVSATKKKRQEQLHQEEDPDVGDDDGDRIDIDNFTNQPLGKGDEAKLKGMASDWANMKKLISTSSFPMIKDVAISMADVAEGDEGEMVSTATVMSSLILTLGVKGLTELDIIMKDLIDIDEEMACHQRTVDDIRQKILQGEDIVSGTEISRFSIFNFLLG